MPPEVITADFFTRQHRIKGQIFTGPRRLTDLLNDELSASVELSDVEVARVIEPEKVIFSYSSAALTKEAIVFALIKEESPNGAESGVFKYVEKKPYDVFLTLSPYEVSGELHLLGTGDLRPSLTRELITQTRRFVPLTRAQAVFTLFPKVKFFGELAIVNKALLEVVGALEAPDTTP